MIERVGEKVRVIDSEPSFVHTVEIGPDFITLFVTSWADDRKIQDLVDTGKVLQHNSERFHADDPLWSWVGKAFPGEYDNYIAHYHWGGELSEALTRLGDRVGPSLREELSSL